jgi:hypothetical protein
MVQHTVLTELQHIFYHNKRVCRKANVVTPNYHTECATSAVAGGPKFKLRSITATIQDHQRWTKIHGCPGQGNKLVPHKANSLETFLAKTGLANLFEAT